MREIERVKEREKEGKRERCSCGEEDSERWRDGGESGIMPTSDR